jgi:hypothetical protein
MWPWEHAAVGYVLLSLGLRASGREPPVAGEAAAVAVATLLPDLVDKPLSWELGWFPSGYAVAHSAFVAVPAGLAALALAWRRDRRRLGVAVAVGYWSHLLADVLDPLRRGERPLPARVLWPVVESAPYDVDYGLGRGLVYLQEFAGSLSGADPLDVVVLSLALPAATVLLWLVDGAPGTELPRRAWLAIHGAVLGALP